MKKNSVRNAEVSHISKDQPQKKCPLLVWLVFELRNQSKPNPVDCSRRRSLLPAVTGEASTTRCRGGGRVKTTTVYWYTTHDPLLPVSTGSDSLLLTVDFLLWLAGWCVVLLMRYLGIGWSSLCPTCWLA